MKYKVKEQSILSKEVKDWEITNLLNKNRGAPVRIKHKEERKSINKPEEEEKIQRDTQQNKSEFDFNLPSDSPPGGNARMEHLRQMEKHLFPEENQPPKHNKNRLNAYKNSQDISTTRGNEISHNFTGNRIKINRKDDSIEQYLKEIRGEAEREDHSFLPEKHQNRVRGLDEQDEIFHPMLSDALA